MIKAVPCFRCATPCALGDKDEYHCPQCGFKATIEKIKLNRLLDWRPGALEIRLIDGHLHAMERPGKTK